MVYPIIIALMFISGAAGLAYQIIWVRLFSLTFGNTALSVSMVLAAFMLGLALGSQLLGRWIDRRADPLRTYVGLEAGIGLSALILVQLLPRLMPLYAQVFSFTGDTWLLNGLRFILSFALVLVPTTLMGGTLPVMAKYLVRRAGHTGRDIGILYGSNTLGAMAGCFVTGFVLIPTVGVSMTVTLAAAGNLVAAIGALGLIKCHVPIRDVPSPPQAPEGHAARSTAARTVLVASGISGFCALGYEVLWTRTLIYALESTAYAFVIMLATVLLGIALGGLVGGRLADRGKPALTFALLQIGIGLSAAATIFILADFVTIHDYLNQAFARPDAGWRQWQVMRFVEAGIVLLPSTLLAGAAFPVAVRAWQYDMTKMGRTTGEVFTVNTVGGVLGALVGGLVIIPLLGTPRGIALLAAINILAGAAVLRHVTFNKPAIKPALSAALIILAIAMFAVPRADAFAPLMNKAEPGSRLIWFHEGLAGTVTVHDYPAYTGRGRVLSVGGTNVAGTDPMLRTTQKLQGHLPLLLHGEPRDVMQIGFGSGETSRAVLSHRSVKSFDLVEISPGVLDAADRFFQDVNDHVLDDPRLKVWIMDGRNYARLTDKRYDVILNDATYPTRGAGAALFTVDHFATLKRRLKPGGIVSTWLPIDLAPSDFRMVLRSFHTVFPHASYWYPVNCVNKHGILVGSDGPLRIDYARFAAELAQPGVADDLAGVNLSDPVALLDALALDENAVAVLAEYAKVSTDDHPRLEFSRHTMRDRDAAMIDGLTQLGRLKPVVDPYLTDAPPEFLTALATQAAATQRVIDGVIARLKALPGESTKLFQQALAIDPEADNAHALLAMQTLTQRRLREATDRNPDPTLLLALAYESWLAGDLHAGEAAVERARLHGLDDTAAAAFLARMYVQFGEYDRAIAQYDMLLVDRPEDAMLLCQKAAALLRSGRADPAQSILEQVIAAHPDMTFALSLLARLHEQHDEYGLAVAAYEKVARSFPDDPDVWESLGSCHMMIGRLDQAVAAFRRAIALDPMHLASRLKLAQAAYLVGDHVQAEHQLTQTIALWPGHASTYLRLAEVYQAMKRPDDTAAMLTRAIHLDARQPEAYLQLAALQSQNHQPDQAVQTLRALLSQTNDPLAIAQARQMLDTLTDSERR